MTKEITKAFILQEIQDKFKMRELAPAKFSFSEEVIPTYEISQHLARHEIRHTTKNITSGPLGYVFFGVPGEERWSIDAYNVIFLAAGAYTVTGLYIIRAEGGMPIYYDMTLGQSVSYSVVPPKPIIVDAKSGIYLYVDSYTATAGLTLYLDVVVETIR